MITDTPELVLLLGQHLNPADLRHCIQVSRLWHETLISCLWRELNDTEWPWRQMFDEAQALSNDSEQGTIFPFDDPRLRLSEMIHKYGHHIRCLKITHVWTLECCLQAKLEGISVLYWKIDTKVCQSIDVDEPREVSISEDVPDHLICEKPNPDIIMDALEWEYVSRCFWTLIYNNRSLTLVEVLTTQWERVLKLKSTKVLHLLLGSLLRLRTLSNLPMSIESILQLNTFAPNLDAFTMSDPPTKHDFLSEPTADSIHHHLRSLTLCGDLTLYQVSNLFQMFPSLEHAQFFRWSMGDDMISYEALTIPIRLEGAHLRRLNVNSLSWVLYPRLTMYFPRLESVVVPNLARLKELNLLLRNCPNLRSIQVRLSDGSSSGYGVQLQQEDTDATDGDNGNDDNDRVESSALALSVQFVRISLKHVQVEESIRIFWRTIPNLTEVSLGASNPSLLAALAQFCPALQRVDMGTMCTWWKNGISCSYAVSELLRSCSDLRSLKGDGLAIGPRAIRDGCAWVCHKIEVLHLDITGFADEISETHFGDDNNDDEEGKYFLQHVVYDQLAQLTRLRSLDMSIACSYSDLPRLCVMQLMRSHQCLRHPVNEDAEIPMDTLQFTLASGLGRLSSLSQLEELGIRGVDHRIWKEELLWMHVHWPRLKCIRGVALRIEGAEDMRVGRTWYVEDGIADLLD
ncbi:hypothetical protein MVEG_01349 [Podila verticillata NRRL 6337]|nr:hypothetical protein MVEG_01349 [Podila verticillata NRRL 6337]